MINDINKIKNEMKKKRGKIANKNESNFFYKTIIKLLIVILSTILLLIIFKKNPKLKDSFYENVYETNITFASINNFYQNLFGSPIPFSDYIESKTQPVFSEKLKYYKKQDYLDGVKLNVNKNYLVPAIESGMVVFIGDKENYPNTLIIEQVNGINVWYSNVENINVNLYDYVDKGSLVASTIGDELYLVYKKNGEILDYNDYI